MARPGRKPDTLAAKVQRGTVAPLPDVLAQLARETDDVPVQYEYLSPQAKEVWDREIEHFIAGGARRSDSAHVNHTVSMIAEYEVRTQAYQAGKEGVDPPPITAAVELRTRLEGMQMAGARSRVTSIAGGKGGKGNAFATNGNRPRA